MIFEVLKSSRFLLVFFVVSSRFPGAMANRAASKSAILIITISDRKSRLNVFSLSCFAQNTGHEICIDRQELHHRARVESATQAGAIGALWVQWDKFFSIISFWIAYLV